jgi:hypothetical protein
LLFIAAAKNSIQHIRPVFDNKINFPPALKVFISLIFADSDYLRWQPEMLVSSAGHAVVFQLTVGLSAHWNQSIEIRISFWAW